MHDARVGTGHETAGGSAIVRKLTYSLVRSVVDRRVIVGEREGAAVVLQRWNDPYLVGQVIDCSFDVLARRLIEELRNGLLHSVGQPRPGGLLLGRRGEIWKLFGEGLGANDGSVEMRRNPVFLDLGDRDVDLALLRLLVFEGVGGARDGNDTIGKGGSAVFRVDTGVPPRELLDRRVVAAEIRMIRFRSVEADPVRKPT